jgi:membrane protein DedA with SNARE-associated domain/pimeloyl-ACP methyl ester carboxylesterase
MSGKKRIRLRYMVLVYAALLILSQAVRRGREAEPPLRPGQQSVTVRAVAGGARAPEPVRMAYTDSRPAGGSESPPLILLHGTPFASETFDALAPLLSGSRRVIVPDLPGFGRSTRRLPDYSMKAHADYLLQLLDRLDIARAHFVGYSQGGGVALELQAAAPDRVASITLLSSIGVQELELLGDYTLNRALYSLQWSVLWLVYEAVPHFGWLDGYLLNVPYARNFLDSDQRPLRAILESYPEPMLILHGAADRLVPVTAAREHARLVPQSEWEEWTGGHGLVFARPALIAGRIEQFVGRVERGEALTRTRAPADRVAAAGPPFDPHQLPPARGLTLLILMGLIALATWASEDLACIGAGLLVARGALEFLPAAAASLAGIFSGDLLLYLAGRWLGQPLLRRVPFKWFIREADVLASEEWFSTRGPAVIIASRFMPGARLPTYLAAGILRMPFWKFTLYFLLAAVLWTPLLVWLAYVVGANVMGYFKQYTRYTLWAAVGLAVLLWLVVRVIVPLLTYRGRRLLLSGWRRRTRWEFWPMWAFYPPLFLYVVWLGFKHRGFTLFTAANPGIPAGGFIGESKTGILDQIRAGRDRIARYAPLPAAWPPERRIQAARDFMRDEKLAFPVVLKPDAGQRGEGVAIVRTGEHLDRYLREQRVDSMIQEFAPGREFGVFYYRHPDQPAGRIFAVTDKRFPVVIGDGRRTLEQLILRDDRAVCLARFFLRRHADHLHRVPAAGEEVPLTELGTHCRGALFLDGGRLVTPELEQAIDRISRSFEGFHFGRYDIRVPSEEEFRRGQNFKIVELNGVTSEATSIYDPGHRLADAYRILAAQWRLAFEIGAAHRARGVRPAPVSELWRLLRGYRSAER